MRYFISLSYKGTSYCGWQIQVNQLSVQAELERAFSIYLGEKTGITGAGRTDTGVHALNYVAHFDCANPILFQDYPKLIYKINAILPSDITLLDICQVAGDAHARFDAISRTYKYYIHTKKDSFLDEYSYFFPYPLDLDKMNLAAAGLLGEHDFTSMAKLHTDVKTNICTVSQAVWTYGSPLNFSSVNIPAQSGVPNNTTLITSTSDNPLNSGTFCFTITANRFLRNMVRAVVGSLLDIGRGKQSPDFIMEILAAKNRCAAGSSVPAHPLFLMKIEYPYKILL
jgi:tRNA pseudouridine38-40 synthase